MIVKHSYDASVVGRDWQYRSANGVVTTNTFTLRTFEALRQLKGQNCPDFQQLIQQQKDATTSMSALDTRVKVFRPAVAEKVYTDSSRKNTYQVFRQVTAVHRLKPFVMPADISDKAQQIARSKFYAMYQTGAQTDVGVIAVELAETVQMLTAPYKKLTREVLKWYHRSGKTADRILRSPTLRKLPRQRRLPWVREQWNSAYLETYFGMLPFMSSVVAACEDLERFLLKPPLVQVSARGRSDGLSSEVSTSGFQSIHGTVTHQMYDSASVAYRGAYPVDVTVHTDFTVPALNSTAVDVYPALWEAIPYSWLVDYVFNIGSVLSAEQSASALRWAWLCQTKRYIRQNRLDIHLYDATPSPYVSRFDSKPGLLVVEQKQVSRTRPPDIPTPSFGLRHKPQSSIFALGAVASVASQRVDNLKRRRVLNDALKQLL